MFDIYDTFVNEVSDEPSVNIFDRDPFDSNIQEINDDNGMMFGGNGSFDFGNLLCNSLVWITQIAICLWIIYMIVLIFKNPRIFSLENVVYIVIVVCLGSILLFSKDIKK